MERKQMVVVLSYSGETSDSLREYRSELSYPQVAMLITQPEYQLRYEYIPVFGRR